MPPKKPPTGKAPSRKPRSGNPSARKPASSNRAKPSAGARSPKPTPIVGEPVRLNKLIADSGLCSRREADRLIEAGQVTVNGRVVTTLGASVTPGKDTVKVSGAPLPTPRTQTVLFHKPKGVITTRSDEKGRATIYDALPPELKSLDPAGRLDKDTSGALILTNDGDLLHTITHPAFHLPKVYRVTVDRPWTAAALDQLAAGIPLEPEGVIAQAQSITVIEKDQLELVLITGYNRQIRRMVEAVGYRVSKLKRTRIGAIVLGNLKPGEFRPLKPAEIRALQRPTQKTARGPQPAAASKSRTTPPSDDHPKPRKARPTSAAPSAKKPSRAPAQSPGRSAPRTGNAPAKSSAPKAWPTSAAPSAKKPSKPPAKPSAPKLPSPSPAPAPRKPSAKQSNKAAARRVARKQTGRSASPRPSGPGKPGKAPRRPKG